MVKKNKTNINKTKNKKPKPEIRFSAAFRVWEDWLDLAKVVSGVEVLTGPDCSTRTGGEEVLMTFIGIVLGRWTAHRFTDGAKHWFPQKGPRMFLPGTSNPTRKNRAEAGKHQAKLSQCQNAATSNQGCFHDEMIADEEQSGGAGGGVTG